MNGWLKYKRDLQKKRETNLREVKVLESTQLTQEICNDFFQKVGWRSLYCIL